MPHPALPTPAPGRVLPGLIPLTGFSWNVSCTGGGQHRGEGWIELLASGVASGTGAPEGRTGQLFLCRARTGLWAQLPLWSFVHASPWLPWLRVFGSHRFSWAPMRPDMGVGPRQESREGEQ